MNKWRVLSIGLAMSLMMTQLSFANVYITPFGTTQTVQESSSGTTDESQPVQIPNENLGTGVSQQGPGAPLQADLYAVIPSASYSTKEPVQMPAAVQTPNPGPMGAAVQSGSEIGIAEIAEPEIAAESAILYDVTHDRVLYEKNADAKRYPASITKLMTALLVLEHAGLNETVTYSETAVTKLESGAVTLSLQAGDCVSVKDSLYGLMLKSANEVANGLAEHVGGSISGFADMMNAKAKALGCTGTNFVNPNGLNDPNHYTTARDMAKIAAAAFENETLCKITSTTAYTFPATKAAGARTITMGHKMLYENDARHYDGIVGGKTGYTSLAGNTLVTCVEQDGVRIIAVILKSRSTHYTDTKALLDYGYKLEAANVLQMPVSDGSAYHKWIADGDIWRFELADGTRLSNCFVMIDGVEYAFDTDGKMVTGWLMLGQNWHYFENSGAMSRLEWRKDGDYWFYLGSDGAMVRNTWIDHQYYVGADGAWVE